MDVVLLHGSLGSAAQLAPLKDILPPSLTPHIVEFEGHGDSEPSDRPFRTQHFAENVLAYMSSTEVERAVLFGYSMGGYVALWLATEAPERVAAVLTLGTKLGWNPEAATREAGRLNPTTLRTKVPRFVEALEARHKTAGGWEGLVERTAEMMTHLGDNPDIGPNELAAIKQPVRLMLGDRDAMVTLAETQEAFKTLASGELAVLPRTPHPFELVDAARVASHILDVTARL